MSLYENPDYFMHILRWLNEQKQFTRTKTVPKSGSFGSIYFSLSLYSHQKTTIFPFLPLYYPLVAIILAESVEKIPVLDLINYYSTSGESEQK